MRTSILILLLAAVAIAQPIPPRDPLPVTALPATCSIGQTVFLTTGTAKGIYACRSANTWTYSGNGGTTSAGWTDDGTDISATAGRSVKLGATMPYDAAPPLKIGQAGIDYSLHGGPILQQLLGGDPTDGVAYNLAIGTGSWFGVADPLVLTGWNVATGGTNQAVAGKPSWGWGNEYKFRTSSSGPNCAESYLQWVDAPGTTTIRPIYGSVCWDNNSAGVQLRGVLRVYNSALSQKIVMNENGQIDLMAGALISQSVANSWIINAQAAGGGTLNLLGTGNSDNRAKIGVPVDITGGFTATLASSVYGGLTNRGNYIADSTDGHGNDYTFAQASSGHFGTQAAPAAGAWINQVRRDDGTLEIRGSDIRFENGSDGDIRCHITVLGGLNCGPGSNVAGASNYVSGTITSSNANAQGTQIAVPLTELLTVQNLATTDTSISIPAGVLVLGVSVRVTTAVPTAATFTVTGTSSGTTFNTVAVSTALNTTDPGTAAGVFYNATAQTIRITPNLTPGTNAGRVRVSVHYISVVPAAS